MFNATEIVEKAIEKLKEIHGEDFKAEVGDDFVFALNNCTLILSQREDKLEVTFTGEKVIPLDMSSSAYDESIDIYDFEYAEAIYTFVGQPHICDDFRKRSCEKNLSIAEYVEAYKYNEFQKWYAKNYNK